MFLKQKVTDATKVAMKNKDKSRLTVLRSFSAAIKKHEIDEQVEATEVDELMILDKLIKQRKDSESQYRGASRDDLADKEAFEITVLSEFLPKQLTEDEVNEIIEKAIAEINEPSMAAMGKVVALVKPQVQGKADFGKVSQIVKSKLIG